jgi:YHS domain-containing protein
MDWVSVWVDIVGGLLIAGALTAWVPDSFWRSLFFTSHHTIAKFWGPLIGPLIAILSFVCSIGNVPLAAVLWNGGISFGGVLAFIFADLIILPIINAYRKYYGARFAALLTGVMFATMVVAALIVDGLFSLVGIVPTHRPSIQSIAERPVTWNYTSVLDVIFGVVFVALIALTLQRGSKDPVCGMTVNRHAGGPSSEHHGHTAYFCSEHCKHTFDTNPEAYT